MAILGNTVAPQTSGMPACDEARSSLSLRDMVFAVARSLRDNEVVLRCVLLAFRTLQRIGISVVPNHYYWPVPDLSALSKRDWQTEFLAAGVDMQLDAQVDYLWSRVRQYLEECNFSDHDDGSGRYHFNNGFFECVDAEVAYSTVRNQKPARIVEIGGGYSSRVLAAALENNFQETGHKGELITIDPYLERGASNGYDNAFVLRQSVQEVSLELFRSLDDGDILFLDSSHVVAIGSDVVREYLDILPRLRRGVLVHVHDIFLPHDYPREFIYRNLCFWSEQYLLQAFLSFNSEYELIWGSSAMAPNRRELLGELLPRWTVSASTMPRHKRRFVPALDSQRLWPSSFWIRRR